jgi:hypothetical protein
LPYCFVLSDCASAWVSCSVEFDGFTPVLDDVGVVVCAVVVVVAAVVAVDVVCGSGGASFFC